MMRAILLRSLLGRPYRVEGDGPDAFDCYGLVAAVLQGLGRRELPPRGDTSLSARRGWIRLPGPVDCALVFMGAASQDRHIGIYIAEGGVLHAIERLGVVFDDVNMLRFRGFSDLRFYGPR